MIGMFLIYSSMALVFGGTPGLGQYSLVVWPEVTQMLQSTVIFNFLTQIYEQRFLEAQESLLRVPLQQKDHCSMGLFALVQICFHSFKLLSTNILSYPVTVLAVLCLVFQIWLVSSALRLLTYKRCWNLFSGLWILNIPWNSRNFKSNPIDIVASGIFNLIVLYPKSEVSHFVSLHVFTVFCFVLASYNIPDFIWALIIFLISYGNRFIVRWEGMLFFYQNFCLPSDCKSKVEYYSSFSLQAFAVLGGSMVVESCK